MAAHMPGDPDAGGRFVRLDDGDMHVVEDGRPGEPAVLLIHGTAASAAWWDPVIPQLAGALGLPVLVIFGADDHRWRSSSAAGHPT